VSLIGQEMLTLASFGISNSFLWELMQPMHSFLSLLYIWIVPFYNVPCNLGECCLTQVSNLSDISCRDQFTFRWDDGDVCFVL